jgi:signal transduction histidine kinase
VTWGGNGPTDRILMHLAEIGAGRCTITEQAVVSESDPEMRQVLMGLLVLHEDLAHLDRQRTLAEERLRSIGEERERLLEDRRQAVAARDKFLAVAAHELRTPLATLALLVDHLIATLAPGRPDAAGEPQSRREQLSLLHRQVERLTALVGQMLDVSRITGGRLEVAPAPVDLRDLAREVLDCFNLEVRRRQVSVTLDAPEPVNGTWDGARIEQVMTNLISNALKYGAGRPIEVSVRAEPPRAVVVVRDHGLGIPEDEQHTIFGPFSRAATAKHYSGLGLGLWIAQQIVQASGGIISVQSRQGNGSTFRVELPL